MNHYKIEQRTHEDRTEFSVVDEINGDELSRVRVYAGERLPYAIPDIPDIYGGRQISEVTIMNPYLVEMIGVMFLQAAALLRKELSGG